MIKLGLGRISRLLSLLGNPEKDLKVFHVAGTNGKGSVCTYIESVLTDKFTVGKFTSPHLISPNDAVTIDKQPLELQAYKDMVQFIQNVSSKNSVDASEFEIQTATAFLSFKACNVDVAVVEVGVGGKEDATNILQKSNVLCSIITKIGLDHEALLGNSLTTIAEQKAGILKEGVPCVVDGSNDAEVLNVVSEQAKLVNSPVHITDSNSSDFREQNKLVAIDALRCVYPEFSVSEMKSKMDSSYWPGRLQWVSPNILIDGAHNAIAAVELRRYIDTIKNGRKVRLVMAFSKPADKLIPLLVKPGDSVIATEFDSVEGMPWVKPQPASSIAAVASRISSNVEVWKDISCLPDFDGITVICGSLYLVGQYMKIIAKTR